MAFFRLQNNIPNVYVDYSRDFQVLCRAYDTVNNEVQYHIDSIHRLTDTAHCPDTLLPLLQEKLGFFSSKQFTSDELRCILDAFPYIVRHKGSLRGIQECVNVYLKSQNIDTDAIIIHSEDTDSASESVSLKKKTFILKIGIQSSVRNLDVLEETLKYVIPTGYITSFFFYLKPSDAKSEMLQYDNATLTFITSNVNSVLYGDYSVDLLSESNPTEFEFTDDSLVNVVNTSTLSSSGDDINNEPGSVTYLIDNGVTTSVNITKIDKVTGANKSIKNYVLFNKEFKSKE